MAWCVTHAMSNIQDLFIERFEEAGRRYLHEGTLHDTEIQGDTIHVRGQNATEQVTIHRAKRIAARLDTLESLSIETMSPIMMDQSSAAAHLFRDHLSRHQPQSGETAALCQQLLDWDGVMEKAAITPTLYARLRLAMSKRLAEVAGLARPEGPAADMIGPGDMLTQTWWVLPGLLRSGDTTLLRGTDWAGLTEAALQDILTEGEAPPWGEVHRPVIAHPLARVFPEAAGTLDLATAAIGGDNDTVCATGIVPAQGLAARYAAIARYAFDLSDWSACRWIACHGTAADPTHPHGQDQHGIWAEGQMIPMLYDWPLIEQQASLERQPEGSGKLAP